jgi:hypothetical protein
MTFFGIIIKTIKIIQKKVALRKTSLVKSGYFQQQKGLRSTVENLVELFADTSKDQQSNQFNCINLQIPP